MDKVIFVIDMKAFFASIECVDRNLDPFKTYLAVTDTSRKGSTLVLSVSPALKKLGVASRCRRIDLPKNINIIYANPRMETYIKTSSKITNIFLDYVGRDDLHIYSIDESFLNIGPYLKLYKKTPYELAKEILERIYKETKLIATCGISHNMLLAKLADDLEAKDNKDYIAYWKKEDIENKLWKVKPLKKMWGINIGYQTKLNKLGIYSVGDLANYSKDKLIEYFGVMGAQLHEHANGIDDSDMREKYFPINKNLSIGQVFLRDYYMEELPLIIREMCDDLCVRLRKIDKLVKTVSLTITYSAQTHENFHHQSKLVYPTDNNNQLYKDIMIIYNKYIQNFPIRKVDINFSNLIDKKNQQLSLLKDINKDLIEEKVNNTIDLIRSKYGKNSINRLSSLTSSSTIRTRHNQIGGHKK
ncbi:MAG: Y-family DNA polymerase [Bacillales bacterium]